MYKQVFIVMIIWLALIIDTQLLTHSIKIFDYAVNEVNSTVPILTVQNKSIDKIWCPRSLKYPKYLAPSHCIQPFP